MRIFICPEITLSSYVYRVEMHAHTYPASKCSKISSAELVNAYAARNFDAVTLTNHIRPSYTKEDCALHISDYEAAMREAEKVKLKIYFGVELTFSDIPEEDYLVYGIEPTDIEALRGYVAEGYRAFADSPERKKSIVFTAHPYRDDRIGAPIRVPELSDGVESINMHPRVNSDNGFVTRTAWRDKLLTICGTDCHNAGHEGMAALLVKRLPDTIQCLRKLLASGDFLFEINGNVVLPSHLMTRKM